MGTLNENKNIYNGQFLNGYKNGKGSIKYKNGQIYDGIWLNDKPVKGYAQFKFNGKKSTIKTNGYYKGQVLNQIPNGKGKLKRLDFQYQGDFKNGNIQGYGQKIQRNGNVFKGKWKNGLMHGQGRLNFSNGKVYEGNFENNIISGYGTMKDKNNSIIYIGNFKNNLYHGKGVQRQQKKQLKYEGQFLFGLKQGNGSLQTIQISYQGRWEKDKFHGKGILNKKKQGLTYIGNFIKGIRNGFFNVIRNRDGRSIFSGNFKKGLKHGQGSETEKNSTLNGDWTNGKKNGVFFKQTFLMGKMINKKLIYDMDKIIESD